MSGQPQPGQQPGWQPPSQPATPRKRRLGRGCLYTALGAVGLIIVIIIVAAIASGGGGGGGGGGGSAAGSSSAAAPPSSAASQPGIGDKVRDGKFEFVITKITHAKTVGPSGFGQTAQGRYTILHVTVTNIGNQAQTLDDSSQFLFDAAGRKFDASSQADIYINGSSDSVFLQDINPGNTVHGKIAFDLPSSDKAVKAELHDSPFSDGVTVSLS
jgi:hypothetical protein